jgi:hypothetical protein
VRAPPAAKRRPAAEQRDDLAPFPLTEMHVTTRQPGPASKIHGRTSSVSRGALTQRDSLVRLSLAGRCPLAARRQNQFCGPPESHLQALNGPSAARSAAARLRARLVRTAHTNGWFAKAGRRTSSLTPADVLMQTKPKLAKVYAGSGQAASPRRKTFVTGTRRTPSCGAQHVRASATLMCVMRCSPITPPCLPVAQSRGRCSGGRSSHNIAASITWRDAAAIEPQQNRSDGSAPRNRRRPKASARQSPAARGLDGELVRVRGARCVTASRTTP